VLATSCTRCALKLATVSQPSSSGHMYTGLSRRRVRRVLPDLLAPDLIAVFVGTSVSTTSAAREHYYSHHTNRFWDLLDATGLTESAGLTPERDREITLYGIGLTDLVKGRAASSDALLVDTDYDVPGLIERLAAVQPRSVAFNGKESARRVAAHLGARLASVGPTGWTIAGAPAYWLPSSSATNSRMTADEKSVHWRAFGNWVLALP
jgi:mismatch-specific thymine-DNA glycosylase